MRHLILLLLIVTALASCSFEDGTEMESLTETSDHALKLQKWELVEMSGNIANVPPSTGSEMAWQEYYVLYPDSTFLKARTKDDKLTEATGTYNYIILEDGKYLELSYEADHELIGNCSIEAKELLSVEAEDTLLGTWNACDGPGLVYKRVK